MRSFVPARYPESVISAPDRRVMQAMAALSPPGALVEIGVYKGGSAAYLWEVAVDQGRQLYLFDTFKGMPYAGQLDGNPAGSFADGPSADEIRGMFPGAVVYDGVFPDTLPILAPVSFVHADADQYESTKAICERLPPLMVEEGMIYFDDYGVPGCEGCTKAVDEAFGRVDELAASGKGFVIVRHR